MQPNIAASWKKGLQNGVAIQKQDCYSDSNYYSYTQYEFPEKISKPNIPGPILAHYRQSLLGIGSNEQNR